MRDLTRGAVPTVQPRHLHWPVHGREAAGEWLGVTTEWIGIDEKEPQSQKKVRSNRFLADIAAIRRGEAKGDSVWQALQRERRRARSARHRLAQAAKAKMRLKPRAFVDAEDADREYAALAVSRARRSARISVVLQQVLERRAVE